MTSSELTGTLVLVHLKMKNDPAGKENETGVIVNADLANDSILVGFQGTSGPGLLQRPYLFYRRVRKSIEISPK